MHKVDNPQVAPTVRLLKIDLLHFCHSGPHLPTFVSGQTGVQGSPLILSSLSYIPCVQSLSKPIRSISTTLTLS